MLIEKSNLPKDSLKDKTVLLSGGGGGIGYEAARAFVWLGANVILAELDAEKGKQAEEAINRELNTDRAWFYQIDIGSEKEIEALYAAARSRSLCVDVIFNNATVTPLGAVDAVGIADWDKSYAVNLRAPVLLVRKFLPDMKKRGSGIIVFVPSSGAAPFMGAYEVFKTAQVELCNTLAGELENTGILTYSIGPGLVKTDTARKGIEKVAALMKLSTEEFYRMNEKQMLDAETAGTGFAVSVALADRYNGQEIGSVQALIDGGVFKRTPEKAGDKSLSENKREELRARLSGIVTNYNEQYAGWLARNLFERQWVLRDFKKTTGMSADEMKGELQQVAEASGREDFSFAQDKKALFEALKKYYERQYKLLHEYEKDPQKLEENSKIILLWIRDIDIVLQDI
jgi:NAD(P)-dependent dehydrogenase (short-subunit alcohol dehydrogenase family)